MSTWATLKQQKQSLSDVSTSPLPLFPSHVTFKKVIASNHENPNKSESANKKITISPSTQKLPRTCCNKATKPQKAQAKGSIPSPSHEISWRKIQKSTIRPLKKNPTLFVFLGNVF